MNGKVLGLFIALLFVASMYTESEGFTPNKIGRKRSSIQVSRDTKNILNTYSIVRSRDLREGLQLNLKKT